MAPPEVSAVKPRAAPRAHAMIDGVMMDQRARAGRVWC